MIRAAAVSTVFALSSKTGRVSRAAELCQSFASWEHSWRAVAFWEAQALKYNLPLAPALGMCGSARGAGGGDGVWVQIPTESSTRASLDWLFPKRLISQIVWQFLMRSVARQCVSRCRGVSGWAHGAWSHLWSRVHTWWPPLWFRGRWDPGLRTLPRQQVRQRGREET